MIEKQMWSGILAMINNKINKFPPNNHIKINICTWHAHIQEYKTYSCHICILSDIKICSNLYLLGWNSLSYILFNQRQYTNNSPLVKTQPKPKPTKRAVSYRKKHHFFLSLNLMKIITYFWTKRFIQISTSLWKIKRAK